MTDSQIVLIVFITAAAFLVLLAIACGVGALYLEYRDRRERHGPLVGKRKP